MHWLVYWSLSVNYCVVITDMRNMVSCNNTLQQCRRGWNLLFQCTIYATVRSFCNGWKQANCLQNNRLNNFFRGREIYFTLGIAIYLAWTLTLVSLIGAGIYFMNNCGISVDDEQAQNDFQVIIFEKF